MGTKRPRYQINIIWSKRNETRFGQMHGQKQALKSEMFDDILFSANVSRQEVFLWKNSCKKVNLVTPSNANNPFYTIQ